jgi:hypothetical protein
MALSPILTTLLLMHQFLYLEVVCEQKVPHYSNSKKSLSIAIGIDRLSVSQGILLRNPCVGRCSHSLEVCMVGDDVVSNLDDLCATLLEGLLE